MKHEELITGLKKLHLGAMAEEYADLARVCEQAKKTYEQYLGSLVSRELTAKQDAKIKRLLKQAELPREKILASYDFNGRTGIGPEQIKRLALGDFLKEGMNVVFYGTFGVGKSHLAEGLTRSLCEAGFRCLFTSTHQLIEALVEAQRSLTLAALFKRLDRYDLITLDELGYCPHSKEGADLFFQLISQRYERKSIMITTNLTYSEWDKVFLNSLTTAAAVDRIIHRCETYNIEGPSWREEEAKKRHAKKP